MKKNKAILFSIFVIFIFSCEEKISFQDERLLPFAENMQAQLESRDISISIHVNMIIQSDLKSNGRKVWGLSRKNTIYIHEEVIETNYQNKPERIEALVAHEIGHNILGLDHSENQYYTDSLGRPIVMHISTWQSINNENINLMYDQLADYLNDNI